MVNHTLTSPGQCEFCEMSAFLTASVGRVGREQRCRNCLLEGIQCSAGEFQVTGGCGRDSSGRCQQCPTGTVQPVDGFRGRQCDTCNYCLPGQGIVAACNWTHQAVCSPCPIGSFSPSYLHNQACKHVSECGPGEFMSGSPSPSSDRQCSPCSIGRRLIVSANYIGRYVVFVCLSRYPLRVYSTSLPVILAVP